MINFIRQLFRHPEFEDDEKTHQAYLLHVILLAFILLPFSYVIYVLIRGPQDLTRTLTFVAIYEVINIIPFIMLRRGHVRLASMMLIGFLWSFFTVISVTSSSIYGLAYMLGNSMVITIAGILLGARGALFMTIVTILEGGILVYAETHGWSPPDILDDALSTWILGTLLFSACMVLQNLSARTVREALQRARASEERYRLISQISADYTFSSVVDEDGNATLNWVAGAFEKMTGYTYDEYMNTGGWLGHIHPGDVSRDEQDMATLHRNMDVRSEIRTFAKNGELRWERIFAHPVWDQKRNRLVGIIGAVQDITEQKHADEVTRQTLLQQTAILNNIPDVAWLKDSEGRYIAVNEQFHEIINLPIEQIMYKTDLELYSVDVAIKFRSEDELVMEKRERLVFEELQTDRNGRTYWAETVKTPIFNAAGEVVGTAGISRDITERRQAEMLVQNRRITLEKVVGLGKRVTQADDLRSTVAKIWHGVHDDLNFDRASIYLYNPERNTMDGTVGTSPTGEMTPEWDKSFLLYETAPFTRVLQKPDGLYFTHNYHVENNIPEGHEMQGVTDYVAVPAWAGDKAVAILCADQGLTHRPITEEQLEALRLFSGYAALAIENARLHEKIQDELSQQTLAKEREENRRSMLEKVVRLGQSVTEVYDLRTTLMRIWQGLRNDLGFDRTGIYLHNPERVSMDGTFGTNNQGEMVDEWDTWVSLKLDRPESRSFLLVLEKPDTIYVTQDYQTDYKPAANHIMSGVKEFAAIAAWAGEKPVAAICVDNRITGRSISEEQLEGLRLFAGYVALSVENARLNEAIQNELTQRKTFIEELESKNAELERFTYTVSHDLKAPLVTIVGFLRYLEKDAQSGRFDKFKQDLDRIEQAANKMHHLLQDLLELSRVGRLMNPPSEVSFERIVNEALEIVHGPLKAKNVRVELSDCDLFVKCDHARVVEVVQNLMDNAIKFMGDQPDPCIQISSFTGEDQQTIFQVRDNGIGIEPEYHEKIFGLFNKLNAESEGTGVGLALVRRIIEVHGGRIWVESSLGRGTIFNFTLSNYNP
jgi:PAS domain S-box-containing protein